MVFIFWINGFMPDAIKFLLFNEVQIYDYPVARKSDNK